MTLHELDWDGYPITSNIKWDEDVFTLYKDPYIKWNPYDVQSEYTISVDNADTLKQKIPDDVLELLRVELNLLIKRDSSLFESLSRTGSFKDVMDKKDELSEATNDSKKTKRIFKIFKNKTM